MKQDSTDPTKLQAKDILTRNRHLLPSEIVDSDQQGDPPAPTDKYDVNSLIDKIYGGGLSAEKPTDKAPSKPIQGKQPEYSEDQQRYAELSTKRQELTRERSQFKSEGTGVNYQQISDISGRLKSIEGEIKDLKPSGAGVRFLNGINNFVQGASEVPVGLLMGIATTAKWLDETLGVDFQPGDVDEQFTYQLGQRLRALVNENFKTDPILQEEFSQQLAAGLGSFLGFAGGGAITKMLTGSMKAAQAFAWVTAGFGGAGRSYEEAKEFGASEDDAQMAAKWGFLPGIVQVSNTALRVLNRWDRAYGGRLVEGLARRVLESGKSGINEALVETLGQVGFNAIAKELYDAERPYMEGWAESASVGGGAGFLSDIILTGLGGRAAKMAGRTNAGEPQNQERPGPIVEREPVTVGKYKDQDVKVVGEDEAGDLYIEFPDGKQKLVDADAISDLVEITPQEQEAAERSMMEIDESESNDAEAQENVVVDPDTGDFLYPGEVGYEEAVAKIDRVSNRITELTIGQGRNRQIVDLQEGADGSFNVLNTKIADGEGGIIETPISELTGKEVNDIVNDLTEELSGRGSEYTIEAMPTDPTDPFSKMQILVMPSDSQLGKSINNKRKLGQYSIEADGAEIKVINPDGKEIGNRSKYFLPKLKEFFEQSADEYSKMPRLTDDPDSGVNEGNFVGEVSQRSENPVEIAEAYQQAIQTLDEQSDGNYKEMIIANDLASSRLPSSDLDGRGLDGAIYYAQYASKRADVDLGMRADYLSDQAGMDISVDDIMDFIRANPGGPKNVINRKPEIIQRLEDQFQKVTGIDINIGVANALTGSQGIERRQTSKEEFLKDLDSDLNSDEDLSALGIKDDSIESVKRELENEGVSKDEIEQIEQAASQTEQSIEDLETAVTTSKTEEETLAELENFFDGLTIKDKSAKPVQAKTETKQEDTDGTITEVAQEDPGISEATEKPKTGAEVENATKDENEGYFPSKSFDKGDVIESQDGVRYEVLNPNKKGRAELKNLSDSTRPGEITDYNADILFFKLSDNQDKNLPKPEKRKVELKNPTEFNAFSDYLDYKRAVYETEGKRKTEIKHLLENQDSHNWRTTHKKQDENKEKETPTKSKNPYDRSKSPLEFAKSFLYARVERGDTLDSMKSYSGRGGSGGSIQIGGYVDGKKYPNTKVIVSEHKGKKVNEVFSVKDIYDSIKDDLEGGGLFNQGETVSDAKETKAEILKSKEEKAKEELNSLFDEFNDQISGQLNTGFDPKLIELSIKIIGKGSEIGYIKFQQFADFVIAQKGEPFFRKIFKNFKAAYMGAMALEGNKHKEDLNVLALSNADDFIKPKDTAEGTINNPVKAEKASDIKKAAKQTDTEPTDPQKEAGNYKMGHINVQGLNITIENPKGSIRRGKASDGTEWEVKMPAHYGYIKRSEGADGDHFDVTIGDSPQSDTVFVIDQIDLDAKFDEHKGFIGFNTRKDAVQAYNDSFSDDSGPSRMGAITEMSMDEFKRYLKGDTSGALLYGKKGKGTADISTHPIMKMRNNFLRDLYESDLPGKGVSYAQVPSKGGFDVTVYVRREGNMPGNAKLTDPEYSVPIELSLGVNTITAKIDHPKPDLDQVTTMIDAMSDVASKSGIEFSTDIVQESSQENIGDTQDNIVPKEGWRDNLIKARQYANELKVPGRADVWTDKEALVSKIQSFVEGDSAEAPVGDIQGLREALSDRGRKFESNIISGVVDMMAPKEGARAFASVSGRYMNENNAPGKGNPVINFDWVNDWAYDPATNTIYAHIIPTRAMDDPQGGTKNFKSDIQDSQEIISKITKLGQQSETDQADLFGQSAQTAKPNKPANKKAESEKPNEITSDEVGFIAEIKSNIKKGRVLSKSQLNALADKHEVEGGDKRIKELAEYAIVSQARQIVESNPLADDAYSEMVDLYTSQPNLTARTSSSIELQQYSTPAPLAYMMGRYVNLHNGVAGFEPSAGNGLLTIAAGKSVKNIIANEIDSDRLDTLNQQGFNRVTNQDGSKEFTGLLNTQQAIVTNPPFGATDARFGYTIDGRNGEMTKLEHVMSARALQTMRDDGKAAIIIGGNDSFNDNGMRTGQDGVFFNWLYHNYNVEDIINLDGAFFRKQGTSFPTRIILVNGRKMLPEGFAPLHEIPPKVVDSFDSFYQIINTKLSEANHEAVSQPQLDSGRGTDSTVSDKGSRFGSDNIGGQTDSIPTQGSRNDNRSGRKPGADNQGNDAGATRGDIADGQSGLFGEPASQQQSLSDTSKSDQRAIGQQSEGESSPGQAEQQRTPRSTPREKSVLDSRITAKDVLDNDGGNLDYAPLSNSGVIQTEMPATMAMSMRNTLEGLADRVGNVDAFVMDKLGYDNVDQLYDALAAEQVDAVALAIAQIENGKSLIVGDQTGIGKGRVAASMIRYAKNQGMTPVFFTEKDNLFTDMHRDLVDVGSSFRPFIVNSSTNIEDQSGKVVFRTDKTTRHNKVLKNPSLASEYDYVAVTYSQIQSENYSKKRDFIKALAPNALIIMDESHNASGNSNTGEYMMEVIGEAKGAVYLSATFAKRPDNMPVYAIKTDISDVAMDTDEMIEAIERGGVALQEIISSDLVKSGQMVRRQRSFKGVKREFEVMGTNEDGTLNKDGQAQRKLYDEASEVMRDIIDFQNVYVSEILSGMEKSLKMEAKEALGQRGVKKAGVDNQPFVSRIHNIVDQLLFSIKVDAVADEAIRIIKSDRKPVIAVKSTMETILDDTFTTGEGVESLNFGIVMERALKSVMKYRVKDAISKTEDAKQLTREELSDHGKRAYDRIVERSKGITTDLHPSPLDYLVMKIEKAGFSVGEVTGRSRKINLNPDGTGVLQNRTKAEKDKTTLYRGFNEGDLDALIINSSGATGASAHSSEKFGDRRQRVMIIHQPELNINTEVQKWGRIFRTGQVVLPEYKYITSSIPAETRLMMVLKKKIKSLDANVTSSQKTSSEFLEMEDFINKYGDFIVTQYLRENQDLHQKMQNPIGKEDWQKVLDGSKVSVADIAMKATGRIALLDSKTQEDFYEVISERYASHIDMLNEYGENELIMDSFDLQAETVKKDLLVKGDNKNSVFGGDSYLETVQAKVLRKPMKREELDKIINDNLGGKIPEVYSNELAKEAEFYIDSWLSEKRLDISRRELTTEERIEVNSRAHDQAAEWKRNTVKRLFNKFKPRDVYVIPADSRAVSGITKNAIFVGFDINPKSRNPFAPSAIKLKFVTNDTQRSVTVPGSNVAFINSAIADTGHLSQYARNDIYQNWDSKLDSNNFETRLIATGNILQAMGKLDGKGQLIQFTTKDGSIKNGVLLPKNMKEAKLKKLNKVRVKAVEAEKQVFDLRAGHSLEMTSGVSFERDWHGTIRLNVQSSKVKGGKFFLDTDLRDLVGDFTKRGSKMKVDVPSESVSRVLKILTDKFSVYAEVPLENVQEGESVRMLLSESATEESLAAVKSPKWRQSIKDEIKKVTSKWANDDFVHVVDTVDDLPVGLKRQIYTKGTERKVLGVYLDARVYIVADNAKSPTDAIRTLAHEAFGHLGIRSMVAVNSSNKDVFENRMNKILQEIHDSFSESDRYKHIVRKYNFDTSTAEGRNVAADEFLANVAEGDLTPTMWDKIVKFINDLMKSVGFDVNWTRADVLSFLQNAKKHVEGDQFAAIMGDGSHLRTVFFDLNNPVARLEQLFQSTALMGIDNIKQNAATGDQWMKMISDQGGKGTAQELEWIGLKDFLDGYISENNVKSVPKEVVQQYIRDNQIEINEVQLSGEKSKGFDEVEYLGLQLEALGYEHTIDMYGQYYVEDLDGNPVEYDGLPDNVKTIVNQLGELQDPQYLTDNRPQYGSHTVPGGDNYREILLTMPSRAQEAKVVEVDGEWYIQYPGEQLSPYPYENRVMALQELSTHTRNNAMIKRADEFRSPHYQDHTNILAHVRVDDRTLPNGEKVLFINEIQSDWAQTGRKKGFKSDKAPKKLEDLSREELIELLVTNDPNGTWTDSDSIAEGMSPLTKEEAISKINDWAAEEGHDVFDFLKDRANTDGAPDMPYKKTDQWVGMAIRRMLAQASDQGYDRVAWITGEQASDLYNLSKRVDKIESIPDGEGSYSIFVWEKGSDSKRGMGEFSESKLEEVVGKDLAEKIINAGGRGVYEGQDLEVGGEGMKTFYNKIIPKIAEKEARRFDKKAKVEVTELSTNLPSYSAIELDSSSIPENLFKIVLAFKNEVFDRQRLDERLKQEGYKAVVEPVDGKVSQLISINERISKQLSIKLTDTAKENLSDAVPLFKVEDSQPEVRYRLGGGHNLSDYKFAYYRKYDEWVRRLHDRGIAGQRLIEGVTRDGGRVTDQSDFKQDDELKRGRVEIQLNRFENGLKKEYVQIMQQGNKGMGITYEDYQDFIKARHAPDVNKRFEELTGEKNRSGLSKERIDEINAKIDNNGWRSHMESFGDVHDQIIDKNLKAQVAYGLITPGMYGKLKKMYPKYAPMRGFKDFEGVDPTMYVMPETQEGRSSEPGDVIGYTIALVESNIIRGETNLVKEKIFNFAADNPDFQKVMRIKNIYWRDTGKIDADTGKKRYIAELDKPTAEELLTGVVVRDIDPNQHLTEWSERDNPFTEGARNLFLMKRGKPAFIEFSDPHIAEWMKGHDMDIMPEAMNALGKYMRFLRNAYITYSPEFPLRNMVRDGTTGVLHIATDFDTKTAMAIGNPVRLARLMKPIWRALYKDEFGGDFGKNIKNFIHHGGMSGYYQLSPLKRLTKDLTEAIDQHGSNWYKVKKAGKAFHHIMQSYTSTVENLIRLSGYDYFMENKVLNPKTGQAFTPKQAARYFKSLTVNFDKKGSWAGTIGNIWIFYNATQKNVARLAEPFLEGGKRRRTRAAAVPLIMGSVSYAMADLLRIGLGVDEDDEFRFDKLNNFTVAHRIMIPNFASDDPDALISVPLPYGQNVYWAAGVYANKVANNVMTPQEMAFNLASISWQSFNPIGGEATDAGIVQSGTKSLLPTIFVPPFELATNVDFRGMPIIPEQRYGDRHIPQHKNYRYYTQQWAIDTAKALNRISGGDDYTEGLIEMSPNAIEFLVSNYLGGAGYFAISSMNAAQKVVDHLVGDNLLTEEDIMRFPVARVYFAKVPASGSRRRFYENLDALNEIEWKYDQMIADERFGEADRFAEDNANLFDLIPFKNSTRVSVTNHFSELNKLPTDLDNYDQISEEILDRIQRFYNEFNSEYNRAAGTSASQNPPSLTRILNPSLTNILE